LRLNVILKKLDRIVAWILAPVFLAMMISGYISVKGFPGSKDYLNVFAYKLHTQLDLPLMLLFSIHFAINLKFTLMRYSFKDSLSLNLFCLFIALILFLFIVYLDLR
jgi:hypothetical protein